MKNFPKMREQKEDKKRNKYSAKQMCRQARKMKTIRRDFEKAEKE